MKTINSIARLTLERIYGKDECIRVLNFINSYYNLDKVLDSYDTRTLVEVEAEEENSFTFMEDSEFSDDPNHDPEKIYRLFVWGITLGLREIPILMGSKTIIDRIIEEEEKTCWIMNQDHFSHLVIERQVAIKNGYPIYEVDVYRISEIQWKEITKKIFGT